jgi:demethylmenaquinone methyltransferase/2-methoxy-6-polyprenyl-1,4-benzoquinol methylase
VYDRFVALHSAEKQGDLRKRLADQSNVSRGARVLDLCTGTGSLLLSLHDRVHPTGMVVGLDFSRGMLDVARQKNPKHKNIYLIQADAGSLPFREKAFHAVTCSHAFYELKGKCQDACLIEVVRALKKSKPFLMMEHEIPKNRFIRMLFYIRLLSMGPSRAFQVLRKEETFLRGYFHIVKKIPMPGGRSKVLLCLNHSKE